MKVAFRPLYFIPYFKKRDTFWIVIIINEYDECSFGKIYFQLSIDEED